VLDAGRAVADDVVEILLQLVDDATDAVRFKASLSRVCEVGKT